MKIWAKTEEFKEGKFLVVRRDGSIPAWPHFVIGARDPAAPAALMAYAAAAREMGMDPDYCQSIRDLAGDFAAYRGQEGSGDPDAAPHRIDNPTIIALMSGEKRHGGVYLERDQRNVTKIKIETSEAQRLMKPGPIVYAAPDDEDRAEVVYDGANGSIIRMGSPVSDVITKVDGVVTGIATYISGCTQALITRKVGDDGKVKDQIWIDIQRLEATGDAIRLDNGKTPGCDIPAPKR